MTRLLPLLTCAVLVWATCCQLVDADKEPVQRAPLISALIVPEGKVSRKGVGEAAAIRIVDEKTLKALEAFFPNYRQRPSSFTAGGWKAKYRVYFDFPKGTTIRVTVSGYGDWSVGDGDFRTKGDFNEFVNSLRTPDVSQLGSIHSSRTVAPFRVQPYLRIVRSLQAKSDAERERLLKEWAADEEHAEKVFILCRMLFEAKEGGEFRRPGLGAADFLGGTTYDDWPLEPITIFEGVPFLVVRSYAVNGRPEAASQYVEYCLKNCRWTQRRYGEHTQQRLEAQCDNFIRSRVWKQSLTDSEVQFLKQQISAI